jgi:hypothetical protein
MLVNRSSWVDSLTRLPSLRGRSATCRETTRSAIYRPIKTLLTDAFASAWADRSGVRVAVGHRTLFI